MFNNKSLLLLSVIILFYINVTEQTHSSEVFSCGGFVKINKDIDKNLINYENIKIKLISAIDNRVLESTECSPNGYYFLPIYDKGNYFFEISGPKGWSFKNKRISLNINSNQEDQCSEDINFELNGFTVEGYVKTDKECQSQNSGLKGIKIELKSSLNSEIQSTETNDEGYYIFESVIPSKYDIIASHKDFKFKKSQSTISFKWDNVKVDDLQVNGFTLRGRILKDESLQGISNVDFKLFNSATAEKKLIDSVSSNENGEFIFKNLECAKGLSLRAEYSGKDNIKYDIVPLEITSLNIDTGGLILKDDFKVMGFSVQGKVVDHKGDGIEMVDIYLNDELKTQTSKDGSYTLEKIKSGKYKIDAKKEHYQFQGFTGYQLSANSLKIHDIKVKSYSLCGKVLIPKPPAGIKVNPREITLQSSGSSGSTTTTTTTTKTDSSGNYCFEVQSGSYIISVSLSENEKSKGLQFASHSITTTIGNKPQLLINFSQSYSTIQGKINLIKPSPEQKSQSPQDYSYISIVLTSISRKDEEPQIAVKSISKASGDITFTFQDLLPGTYKVQIKDQGKWCWSDSKQQEKIIEITSNQEKKEIEFTQYAFLYQVKSSTDGQVKLSQKYQGIPQPDDTITLKSGLNDICLKQQGTYEFLVESCFKFEQDQYIYDTLNPNQYKSQIDLSNIKKYLITGEFNKKQLEQSDIIQSEIIQIDVYSHTDNGDDSLLETIKASKDKIEFWANYKSDIKSLKFQPRAFKSESDLLFYPKSQIFAVPSPNKIKCPESLPKSFQIKKGLFLSGKVIPATKDVEITASSSSGIIQKVQTDENGSYTLGPLYDDQEYTLKATKQGYNFHRKDQKTNDFNAVELGSFELFVQDSLTKQGISGVLLSLSGEDGFRQNIQTSSTGRVEFNSLYPGQYFLKSFLKEYSLSPSSQVIEIQDGGNQHKKITIQATRVAFSVLGNIKSLNGQNQSSITVQAIDSLTDKVVEESQSNEFGFYRIRGLLPNQSYKIKVNDERIEKSTPSSQLVVPGQQDIDNIDFVVIALDSTFELTGNIEFNSTSSAISNSAILPIPMKLTVLSEDKKTTLHTQELRHTTFFDLGQIAKSKSNLVLKVEPIPTTINTKKHNKDSEQQLQHIELTFKSKEILIESSLTKGSTLHIPIVIEFERQSLLSSDPVSVPWFGLVVFVCFIITSIYPKRVWNLLISIKNTVSGKKSIQRRSKKTQVDNEFLPKELRLQQSKETKKKK